MARILAGVFGLVLLLAAVPAFCDGPVLWQDAETGQLFSKPADGRVPVDPVKDLQIPAAAASNLYEDENGVIFSRPGAGRNKLAIAPAENVPVTTTAQSSQPGDYSGQAFADAVKNVIGEKESKTFPKVKIGAEAYIGYSYDYLRGSENSDKSKKNSFSLNRGYLNVNADLTPEIKFRFTPDISRVSGITSTSKTTTTVTPPIPGETITTTTTTTSSNNTAGDYELRVKYLYAEFHDFLKVYPSLDVKLGQFQGAWLDHEEGLWTYRVQGTMLAEREGFMNSADLGVNFQGKIPAGYGEWQANVNNGEGYHADEVNKYKSLQARLTINPLPKNEWTKGLEFTGFTFFGRKDRITSKDIYIAFLGYKLGDDLFVGGEYDWTHGPDSFVKSTTKDNNVDGAGYSLLAWYRMPFWKPIRIMGRYDSFDHDVHTAHNTDTRYIYGISYDYTKYVTFLLDNERTIGGGNKEGYTSKAPADQNLLKADVLVRF